jgi:hypothetical protein
MSCTLTSLVYIQFTPLLLFVTLHIFITFMRLESFTATKSDTIFSGDPPRRSGVEVQQVGDRLCLLRQGVVEDL